MIKNNNCLSNGFKVLYVNGNESLKSMLYNRLMVLNKELPVVYEKNKWTERREILPYSFYKDYNSAHIQWIYFTRYLSENYCIYKCLAKEVVGNDTPPGMIHLPLESSKNPIFESMIDIVKFMKLDINISYNSPGDGYAYELMITEKIL